MAKDTYIEWCDSTLNLMMGCDGCELWNPKAGVKKCYAGVITQRYGGASKGYPPSFDQPRVFQERLREVLKWTDLTGTARVQKPWLDGLPRTIFLNDMGDTFTKSLALDWMSDVFTVCPKGHTPPVVQYLKEQDVCCCTRCHTQWKAERLIINMLKVPHLYLLLTKRPSRGVKYFSDKILPKFWLGTSLTTKRTLPRLEQLKRGPASNLRFLSIEPLWEDLGQLDLNGIDWVIVGGESGHGATPCDLQWIRNIVEQCQKANIPVFVKQLGSAPRVTIDSGSLRGVSGPLYRVKDAKGGDMSEWPEDLRVRQMPKVEVAAVV